MAFSVCGSFVISRAFIDYVYVPLHHVEFSKSSV